MQRQNNDPFTCQDINDTTTEPAMAHVIKIGKIHALTAGLGQINTNDNQSCVKATLEDTIIITEKSSGVSSAIVVFMALKMSDDVAEST
jgi:hypothetical protein